MCRSKNKFAGDGGRAAPRSLYLLPPPDLPGPDAARAWLRDDALALFLAVGAGLEHLRHGPCAAVFDALLTDVAECVAYALRVTRREPPERPVLALRPTPNASFAWASERLEDALSGLALQPSLPRGARDGLAILGAVLAARRATASDAERQRLTLPRGEDLCPE